MTTATTQAARFATLTAPAAAATRHCADTFDVDAATFFLFGFPAAGDEATFATTFHFADLDFEVTLTVADGTLIATVQGPKTFFGKTVQLGLFSFLEADAPAPFLAPATFDAVAAGFVTGQAALGDVAAIRTFLRGGDQVFFGAVTA